MRNIKFRIFSKEKNKMINWDEIPLNYGIKALNDSEENDTYSSWMQYTGMKDRNGKEIYEKDILRVWIGGCKQDCLEVVESLEELYLEFNRDDPYYRFSCCEVVGDIYSNPELMESK